MSNLTTTQVGAIGENLLVNSVMIASEGRLSPFQPLADDDGLDVLFFDKLTGRSVAVQLKCRTVTLKDKSGDRGNNVHFGVRNATFNEARRAYFVAALLTSDLTQFDTTWFMPLSHLPQVGSRRSEKWVIRPSKAPGSKDKFIPYRCLTSDELTQKMISVCNELQ